jgi:ESF2/ABP1 family protein
MICLISDIKVRKKRQRFGGSKKKNFTEGWVEFKDKRIAKAVAKSLNNTQIGGQKHSRYYDDLWNIKYLPKFRWTHLTEKLAYESAAREQRMRTEMSQAKRETQFYLESVDKQKEISAIEQRKRKRGQETEEEAGKSSMRSFRQRKTRLTESVEQYSNLEARASSSGLPTSLLTLVGNPYQTSLSMRLMHLFHIGFTG